MMECAVVCRAYLAEGKQVQIARGMAYIKPSSKGEPP